jgi:hypothetical protein
MDRRSGGDTGAAVAAAQWHFAAVSAITGGLLGLASALLLGAAFGFRFGDPAPDLITLPASRAGFIRWGALTDMLGFYLLPVPWRCIWATGSTRVGTRSWPSPAPPGCCMPPSAASAQ